MAREKEVTTPVNIELCETNCIHNEVVAAVNPKMPPEEKLYDLADFFKVFGDSTRIKILYVLLCSDMCVCDIAEILGMSQSAISHQLRTLKQMALVKSTRSGKSVVYGLTDGHIQTILSQGLEHIDEP